MQVAFVHHKLTSRLQKMLEAIRLVGFWIQIGSSKRNRDRIAVLPVKVELERLAVVTVADIHPLEGPK